MAQYPGGSLDRQGSRIRMMIYGGSVLIIVIIIAAIVYIRLRGQTGEPAASDVQPSPVEAIIKTEPVQPGTVASPNTMPPAVAPAAAPSAAPATVEAGISESNQSVGQLIAQAMALVNQSPGGPRIIEARDRLNELLPMAGGQERAFIKEQLSALADKWLFSKGAFPEDKLCNTYKVVSGDVLANIAKKFNVPYEILMQINGIERAEALQAGATIKAINGPFNARVYRSTFTMDLYLQNMYVKSFPVGLGQPGKETPTGRWRVKDGGKLVKPIWTDPTSGRTYHPEDPDYPLGSRWIALEGIEGAAVGKTGFAIHGTKDPQQIGAPGSQGCIRLHNGDAITVYNMMMPGRSLVDVVD